MSRELSMDSGRRGRAPTYDTAFQIVSGAPQRDHFFLFLFLGRHPAPMTSYCCCEVPWRGDTQQKAFRQLGFLSGRDKASKTSCRWLKLVGVRIEDVESLDA